jgi:hypothetical protein
VSASKRRELEREANVGEEIVAAASRKTNNEDPLPFLRKPSSKHPFQGGSAATRKRPAMGPMGKILLGLRNVLFSSTFPFIIPYISSSH